MTTREEMALAFARDAHQELMKMIRERVVKTEQDVDDAVSNLIEDSVTMADRLLAQLSKGQPPIKPQVNLKDREACG